MLPNEFNAAIFGVTLDTDKQLIRVSALNNTSKDFTLFANYRNSESRQEIETLSLDGKGSWKEFEFEIPGKVYEAANDFNPGMLGKQVAFQFWNSNGTWLSDELTIAEIAVFKKKN